MFFSVHNLFLYTSNLVRNWQLAKYSTVFQAVWAISTAMTVWKIWTFPYRKCFSRNNLLEPIFTMLHEELIIKGPPNESGIPSGWSMGKYMMDRIKKRNPDELFCIDGITKETLTCGQLVNNALKLAHILRTLGVEKGDAVAIISDNSIKYCAPFFALFYIGAAANLLNPTYTTDELKSALNITKAKVIFCSNAALKNVNIIRNETDFIKNIIIMDATPDAEYADIKGIDSVDSLLETTSINTDSVEPADLEAKKNTVIILLSSGTTGLPKCVMNTAENFRSPATYFNDPNYVQTGPEDVAIGVLPFFHIFGGSALFVAAVHSTKLVILSSFKPDVYLQCIQKYKVTFMCAVPPIIAFLAKHPLVRKFDLSSVKCILAGGGFLGQEIYDEFTKVHPTIKLTQMYGLTEMTGAATFCPSDKLDKLGSVGYLIPDTEAMVWNKDLNENVGSLEKGELCFKGPSLMKGYMEHTNDDIDEFGFYHTGDLGFYDEDGYFYIVGRIKELIKYKGFQVSPAELEDLLTKHPAIKECGVIGIPDDRAGQLPTALIVRQNDATVTEKEVVDFVAERISVNKHLYGGVKFIDFIPRNATGKILRDKLQELY